MKRAVLLKSLMIGFAILLIPSSAIMQWITHTHPVSDRAWIGCNKVHRPERISAKVLKAAGRSP